MSPFEYIIPLVSVIVGLAIADLATSLHRLLRARHRVQWDWLPLTTALLAILAVLDLWWSFYRAQDVTLLRNFGVFLLIAGQLVILFLINAAALPDKVPPEGLNLQKFYEENSAYFWSLFAVYIFGIVVYQSTYQLMGGRDFSAVFFGSGLNLITIALYISLVFIKKRLYHAVMVIALLIWNITQWSGRYIGAV